MKTQLLCFGACVSRTWQNAISDWKAAMPAVASAYQRTLSMIDPGAKSDQLGLMPAATSVPDALDVALKRTPAPDGIAIGRNSREKASKGSMDLRSVDATRQDIERGENEGMAVPSEKTIALRRDCGTAL
jgi:hypothetical protein